MNTSLTEAIDSYVPTITDPRLKALLTDLLQEIEKLRARIIELEIQQDDQADAINRNAGAINEVWRLTKRSPSVPKGQKTKARLEDLERILKSTEGRTLSQLEKDLDISQQQMSHLISKLDMRRYEIHTRPGKGREKVLKLRSRII